MKKVGSLFLCLLCFQAQAYVFSRSSSNGNPIKWPSGSLNLSYFVDTAASDLTDSQTKTIIENSFSQWNGNSDLSFSGCYQFDEGCNSGFTSGNGVNEIYFKNNSFFDSNPSVIAITEVFFSTASNEIVEADVIVDPDKTFSNDPLDTNPNSSSFFLGDIISHELGHAAGLGHAPLYDVSMIFTAYSGQNTVADDDKAALFAQYPDSSSKGSIAGKVISGSDNTSVFGAQVMAISQASGKVAGAVLSDKNGTFAIEGLDLNTTYFLYVAPGDSVLSSLPSYYSDVKSNFCSGGGRYRGAFFQSSTPRCSDTDKGYPQGILLTGASKNRNIGQVSIRCDFDVSDAYSSDAKSGAGGLNLSPSLGRHIIQVSDSKIGEALTGTFSSSQVVGGASDTFTIDLSSLSSPAGKNLELKVIASDLFFPLRTQLAVSDLAGNTANPTYANVDALAGSDAGLTLDSDNRISLDHHLSVGLNATPSDNVFEVTLTAQHLDTDLTLNTLPQTPKRAWFFPSYFALADNQFHYLLVASVSGIDFREYTVSDNVNCADASNSSGPSPASQGTGSSPLASGSGASLGSSGSGGFGCASVGLLGRGPGAGPGPGGGQHGLLNMVLGFMMSFFLYFSLRLSHRFSRCLSHRFVHSFVHRFSHSQQLSRSRRKN